MQIRLIYEGEGAAFKGLTEEGCHLTLDGSPSLGGQGKGPRPMELVLFGLAGCASMDVLHILRKGRLDLSHAEVLATGHRVDSIPAVFDKIHLQFELGGIGLTEQKAQRAIDLSLEHYCSVAKMLSPHVEMTAELVLKNP